MKIDNLRKYVELRTSLLREKQEIESRLRELNEALGEQKQPGAGPPATEAAAPPATAEAPRAGGRGRRRGNGGLSLRDAVLQLTSKRPMTKEEILQGVKQLGYKFSTNNPLNSLGVILYGKNPRFKNDQGRFSPSSGGQAPASSGGSGRRNLSPEARERIAAAQRARWAKSKRGR